MKIILKDGNVIEIEKPISAFELAKSISEGLAKVAVACKIDGKLCAMNDIVDSDCNFEVLTFAEEDGRKVYRHTCSHILAQAVKNIFPTAKLAIGPAIENGFYYDIDFKKYVINVFGEKDTYLRDLEKTYNVSAMFGIDTD